MAEHNVLQARQALKPYGAAGVKLACADADFCSEAVFKAVGQTRRAVDHDAARVDFPQKALCGRQIICDDGIGVV